MNKEKLDQWLEWAITGLILAILVYAPLAFGAVRNLDGAPAYVLSGVVMGLWSIRLWTRESSHRLLAVPAVWPIFGFLILAFLRYRQADYEYAARIDVLQITLYALLFFAALDNMNRQELTTIATCTLVFLGMVISMYAVYQSLTRSATIWNFPQPLMYKGRASGTFVCPNHLAGMLILILPLGIANSMIGKMKPLLRIFIGYASLVMLAGLGVTISRGGWIAGGIAIAVMVIALLKNRTHRVPALVVLVLAFAAGAFFASESIFFKKRVEVAMSAEARDLNRLSIWRSAARMFADNPWVGVGPGHFDLRYGQYREKKIQTRAEHVHCDYLELACEWGVAGIVLVAAFLGMIGWGVVWSWKYVNRANSLTTKPSSRAAFVLGSSCGLLGLAIHCVIDFDMQIPAIAMIAAVMTGLLAGHWRYATERFWLDPRPAGRFLLTISLLAAATLFTWQGSRLWSVSRVNLRALNHSDSNETMIKGLREAAAIEPADAEIAYNAGEVLRRNAWDDYDLQKTELVEAVDWFKKACASNQWTAHYRAHYAMCLDRQGKTEEAQAHFDAAMKLDPENYYVRALAGWHLIQLKKWSEAREMLLSSIERQSEPNPIAWTYVKVAEIAMKSGEPGLVVP